MRSSTLFALAATFVTSFAATITCDQPISNGILHMRKNGISGEQIPLTVGSDGARDAVITSLDGSQVTVDIVPCNSTFIGAPGIQIPPGRGVVVVTGKISALGRCLTRDPSTQQVILGRCLGEDDETQHLQFWQVDLVYHEGQEATGSDRPIFFKKTGLYHHLANSKLYGE